jgi:hypothetical protein
MLNNQPFIENKDAGALAQAIVDTRPGTSSCARPAHASCELLFFRYSRSPAPTLWAGDG